MPAALGSGPTSGLAVRAAVLGLVLLLGACQMGRDFGQAGGASARGASYINAIRTSKGLAPLAADARLERAALQQAGYMVRSGRMAHTTERGRDFAARMDDNGIGGPAAENIAHGRMDLERLFSMWMNSEHHRLNMLDPRFSRFGLAYADEAESGRKYWALVMAK
jgi:uncharacterized protein YkwD